MNKIIDLSRTVKVSQNAPGVVTKHAWIPIVDVVVPVVTAMEFDKRPNAVKPLQNNHYAALLDRGLSIVEDSGLCEITPADLEVDRLENGEPASRFILWIDRAVNDRVKDLHKQFIVANPAVKPEQFVGALIRIGANATRRVEAPKFQPITA